MRKVFLIVAGSCLIATSLLLTGCGQATASTASNASNSCGSGYVSSSTYGCLQQSGCASGYGLYNGSCVYVGTSSTASSSCVSIYQSIPFYGSGVVTDSSGDVYVGNIPSYTNYGSVAVGTSASAGGSSYSGSSSSFGTLQISVPSYSSTQTSISGYLNLNSYTQQFIVNNAASGGWGASSTPCISGMAVQGRVYSSYFTGNIFLYINGTQHGIEIYF